MSWEQFAILFGGFFGALLFGTLLEYVVHRLMHWGKLLGKKHAEHHRDGVGQGWFGEFWDYILGTIPIDLTFLTAFILVGMWEVGVGFAVGGVVYAALLAYSHQLQHEKPELVFWLRRPVHYLHHKHHMWKHNFGILVDFWDRVFGTYRVEKWEPERRPFQHPWRAFFQIRWL